MNIALDTNAYSDFMRGDGERVRIVRAARSITVPIIVLAELRAGFAAGTRESAQRRQPATVPVELPGLRRVTR